MEILPQGLPELSKPSRDLLELKKTKFLGVKIKKSYKLHPTNYAAAIMQGKLNRSDFELHEVNEAKEYLSKRLKQIPEEMEPYLLNQYSNPTIDS